jgi:hypothetical protein
VSACVQSAPPPATSIASAPASYDASVPANRWRAVLVAGDSSSPAFNNGVETMRDRLQSEGVRNIQVLAADPSSLANAEVASVANVRRALQMQGGSACFAFLTSHGEQSGFFLRASRILLSPASLERALDAGCGSLPTVLIVSACHSGTFITPESRKPNRIILTAAATERSSFGCGAKDEYTHYDRCLLQSLDGAATWRELAVTTRTCVELAERRLNVRQASLPQTFVGASVADLRLPGR